MISSFCFLATFRNVTDDAAAFTFSSDHKLFSNQAVKKNELKIFPLGTLQKMKPPKAEAGQAASKATDKGVTVLEVLASGNKYQIQQPKADLEKGEGVLVPFFWVASTSSAEDANLELVQVKVEPGLMIPCFRNKSKKIDPGQQLLWHKPEEPKAKKPKVK